MERIETVFQELQRILGEVSKSDDYVLKQSKELKLVLYNLQIEHAHITQANGIDAIAIRLKGIIDGIQNEVHDLVDNNRASLQSTLAEMSNFCKRYVEMEKELNELRAKENKE